MAKKKFVEEEVLEKAMYVFWSKGYEATSIRDLVQHLGITNGSLYDTFGSKEALFIRSIDWYARHKQQMVFDVMEGAGDGLAGIESFFQTLVGLWSQFGTSQGCLITNSVTELGATELAKACGFEGLMRNMEEKFEQAVRKAQAQGSLDSAQDPAAIASYLYTGFQGLNVVAKSGKSIEELKVVVEQILLRLPRKSDLK